MSVHNFHQLQLWPGERIFQVVATMYKIERLYHSSNSSLDMRTWFKFLGSFSRYNMIILIALTWVLFRLLIFVK